MLPARAIHKCPLPKQKTISNANKKFRATRVWRKKSLPSYIFIYEAISIFSFTCKTFKSNMADYQGYIILFMAWLVSTIVVRAIVSKKQNKTNRPPSPLALPIIGEKVGARHCASHGEV